ncbi:MAG: hypothetical protein COU08_01865 [Candidatus Harrisonbacteria bacterium CG10_big_fil_rev_8_21_14_0_10_42_17]|uniref:Uncharacterized protein n=1 Tax=Candidatus Harrisonbacteria bacterium CG10_big_fil_rev_8_21_14_0_10_42_17 TaxID=1974584 RepID=A0A2M6WIE4_9BACT|nr:MAG: hypothetical protein COU08_01865 [Candidatus Harrisonbacteria bacterium CG10_big_fil_rev_8_21_14_0_10_42_17]
MYKTVVSIAVFVIGVGIGALVYWWLITFNPTGNYKSPLLVPDERVEEVLNQRSNINFWERGLVDEVIEEDLAVYLADYNGDPALYSRKQMYPLTEGNKRKIWVDVRSLSEAQKKNLTVLQKLISPSIKQDILSGTMSPDESLIIFSTAFERSLTKDTKAYSYNMETKSLKELFTSVEIDKYARDGRFIEVEDISENNFIRFRLQSCAPCDSRGEARLLYDINQKRFKNTGRISDFRWLGGDRYEYKEEIVIPCDFEHEVGYCKEDPATPPFIEGNWIQEELSNEEEELRRFFEGWE